MKIVCAAALAALLGACAVGPDYHAPASLTPPNWTVDPPWQFARPDEGIDRGSWWQVFADTRLNELEAAALVGNPGLAQAGERLVQARASATAIAAGLFPQLSLTGGAAREKISANRPRGSYSVPNVSTVQDDFTGGFSLQYELDLFGGTRRQVEAARAGEQQAQALLANVRLVLTAELAADYFNLRALDAEIEVVGRNIAAQRRALEFVAARHDAGAASGLDLAQQQSQLDTTITQIDLLRVQRAQYEHALAALVGAAAPGFAISAELAKLNVPPVPVGVPSDLLQRRPDIAAAERAMAAANAQIGVAKAAFFPAVSLGSTYGRESNELSALFQAASSAWSLGLSASQSLIDFGQRRANVDYAQAGYRATVDAYRGAVLTAMQEVEDGMTGLANLERAAAEAAAAVHSAQRVVDLANDRYTGGLANYLDVVTAQQALLANERQQVQINGQQMLVAVYLIKALGGGWENAITGALAR